MVNIASIAGKEGNQNMCAYSATKAAVIGFTESAGKEVATEEIAAVVHSLARVARTAAVDATTASHWAIQLSWKADGKVNQLGERMRQYAVGFPFHIRRTRPPPWNDAL
ncbi:MAG: SDR family NAD(P)-dependent oxidoreductase [Bryobacteraceae bacterium]